MNKIAPLAAASLALTLILAGCSPASPDDTGKIPDTAPVASTEPTGAQPEASASAEPAKSSRGNLVKQIGELAGTTSIPSGVVTSRFAVTSSWWTRNARAASSMPPRTVTSSAST